MANTEVGIKLTLSGDQQVRTALSGVEERMDRLTGAVSRAGHYGAAFIGLTQGLIPVAQAAVRAADSVTTLNNQLKLATGSTQAASKAYEALFDIAQRSRVSFTELGGTFASISRAGQELGLNQQRLLGVTEAIGNAMTISGGSAESMSAALTQLGQGLASGTLRGEELNSVMEQTPRLAKAIADGLGVPIGKLREMGAAGEISAEQVIRALENQAAVLRGEVTSSVLTVGQAMTQMQNAAVLAIGEMDKATGASSLAASALSTLATTLGEVGQAFKDNELAIKTGMGALGGAAVGAGLLVAAGNIGKITVAVRALGVALAANPYVLAAMGIAAAGGAFVAYSDAKSNTLDVMKTRLKDLQSLEAKGDRGMYGSKVSDEALANRRAEIKRLQLAIAELDSVNLDTRAEDARMAAMVKNTKAAEADREAYANLSRSLSGFKGNYKEYTDNVALINRLRDRGAITEKEAAQRLAELAQKHGLAAKAVKGNKEAERELAEQRRNDLKVGELRNQQIDERLKFEAELAKQQAAVVAQEYESADATNAQALARELANDKTVDATLAMQQLTLAQLEQQRLDLEATDNVIPGYIQALEARIAAQKRLVAATQTGITQDATDKAAKEAEEAWRKASDKIEDALTDALMRGFESGKDFAQILRDTVVNMFKTMVLRPVIQAIVQPVGQSIAGSLLGSGSASGLSGGLSSINSISTLYSAVSGGMASSIGGALASAGGFLGSSTLSSFAAGMQGSTLAAGLAGPTTAGATGAMGLGASFASALPYVAAAAALVELTGLGSRWRGDPDAFLVQARNAGANPYQSSIGTAFGTVGFANGTSRIRKNGQMISEYGETEDFSVANQKQTLEVIRQLDAAIASTLTEGEIAKVSQNLDGWYKKSWSFSGGMLGDWVADRYRAVFDSMGSSLGKMFAQFKFDEKTLPQYFELFSVLKSGGKDMESFALALGKTIAAGDNTAESALALTQSLVGVNAVLDQLGLGAIQMTVGGANAAAAMLQQFGGVDAFVSKSSAYYQTYYSAAERTADATRQLTQAMAKLGFSMPGTREEFRKLVEAQDLTTDSGRAAFTALIGLSDEFDQLVPKMDTLASKFGTLISGLSDEAMQMIDGQIQASQGAARAARDVSRAYFDSVAELREVAQSIMMRNAGSQQAAQIAYSTQLAKAQAGDISAMKALPDLAGALLQEVKGSSRNAVEYAIASARVASNLQGVAAVADVLGVGADYQAKLYDVNTSLLEVTREQLASGNLTVELLRQIQGALGKVDGSIQASSNLTVGVMKTGNNGIVGALVDNAGNVVAGLNSTTVLQLVAMQNQMASNAVHAKDTQSAVWGSADWQRQAAYDVNNSQHQLGWATAATVANQATGDANRLSGQIGGAVWGSADWQRQAAYDVNNSQHQLGWATAATVANQATGDANRLSGQIGGAVWGSADWQRQAAYDVNNSQWQAAYMLNDTAYRQTVSLGGISQQQVAQLQGLGSTQSEALNLTDIVASATDGSETLLGAVLNRLSKQDNGNAEIVGALNLGSAGVIGKLAGIEAAILQQSAAQAAELARQQSLQKAQASLSALASQQQLTIASVNSGIQNIWNLAAKYGLSLKQNSGANAYFGIDSNGLFSSVYDYIFGKTKYFTKFKDEFYASGGVYDQTYGRAGELQSLASQIQSARDLIRSLGGVPGFSVGGYTGFGARGEPAGIVHRGEVVWSQDDVARAGGVAVVESLRSGGLRLFSAANSVSSPPAAPVGQPLKNDQSERLLRDLVDENRRLNGQMNDLKQEVSQMRKENNLGNSQLATDSKLMRRLQEKWDVTGLPVTTQAA